MQNQTVIWIHAFSPSGWLSSFLQCLIVSYTKIVVFDTKFKGSKQVFKKLYRNRDGIKLLWTQRSWPACILLWYSYVIFHWTPKQNFIEKVGISFIEWMLLKQFDTQRGRGKVASASLNWVFPDSWMLNKANLRES